MPMRSSSYSPRRARRLFDQCLALAPGSAKQIANWLLGDVAKRLNELELDVADSLLTPQTRLASGTD